MWSTSEISAKVSRLQINAIRRAGEPERSSIDPARFAANPRGPGSACLRRRPRSMLATPHLPTNRSISVRDAGVRKGPSRKSAGRLFDPPAIVPTNAITAW